MSRSHKSQAYSCRYAGHVRGINSPRERIARARAREPANPRALAVFYVFEFGRDAGRKDVGSRTSSTGDGLDSTDSLRVYNGGLDHHSKLEILAKRSRKCLNVWIFIFTLVTGMWTLGTFNSHGIQESRDFSGFSREPLRIRVILRGDSNLGAIV